jgi:hypothetical protein
VLTCATMAVTNCSSLSSRARVASIRAAIAARSDVSGATSRNAPRTVEAIFTASRPLPWTSPMMNLVASAAAITS